MAKARRKQHKSPILKFIIIGVAVAIAGAIAYTTMSGVSSPFTSSGGKNFSLKITETSQGLAFVSAGGGGKKVIATGHNSPTLEVNLGDTVTIHVVNEDTEDPHDFVIPEFNVYSKLIDYFETTSVTFVADKVGTFTYTSTTDPEMKGQIVVR